jgi:hypothetical protein
MAAQAGEPLTYQESVDFNFGGGHGTIVLGFLNAVSVGNGFIVQHLKSC